MSDRILPYHARPSSLSQGEFGVCVGSFDRAVPNGHETHAWLTANNDEQAMVTQDKWQAGIHSGA